MHVDVPPLQVGLQLHGEVAARGDTDKWPECCTRRWRVNSSAAVRCRIHGRTCRFHGSQLSRIHLRWTRIYIDANATDVRLCHFAHAHRLHAAHANLKNRRAVLERSQGQPFARGSDHLGAAIERGQLRLGPLDNMHLDVGHGFSTGRHATRPGCWATLTARRLANRRLVLTQHDISVLFLSLRLCGRWFVEERNAFRFGFLEALK